VIKHAGGKLRIDAGFKINNASPLSFAAYLSTPEIVAALIHAGADVGHVTDAGGTKLTDAVANPACTLEMLELIHSSNKVDVNQTCTARTRKWLFIRRLFETMYKSRFVSNTDLIMEMAHSRGGTALHFAAQSGHVHQIAWLLKHGAHQSLHVRKKVGSTPIDVARIFGPFPEAEARLGAVMLDGGFHKRYVVRQGTLLQRRDVHASAKDSKTNAGALKDNVADAPAPAAELVPGNEGPPRVSEPHGNGGSIGGVPGGGSSSGSGAVGDDANGNGGEGGVWSSVASAVAHTFSHHTASDAPQAAPGQDTSHGVDSVRLLAMMESVMEAQTRTLRRRSH
jgi:hypothetical protein